MAESNLLKDLQNKKESLIINFLHQPNLYSKDNKIIRFSLGEVSLSKKVSTYNTERLFQKFPNIVKNLLK